MFDVNVTVRGWSKNLRWLSLARYSHQSATILWFFIILTRWWVFLKCVLFYESVFKRYWAYFMLQSLQTVLVRPNFLLKEKEIKCITFYFSLPLLSIADLPEPPAPYITKGFLEGPVIYSWHQRRKIRKRKRWTKRDTLHYITFINQLFNYF